MNILSTAEAAERLGVSVRRVQQLVKAGRLPAGAFGGALMIQEKDLALVAERKTGRPPNPTPANGQKSKTAKAAMRRKTAKGKAK